jgi:hypothetical protein
MTYGEETARRISADNPLIQNAALGGNREALDALLSLAATTGYTDGMVYAAETVGFPL